MLRSLLVAAALLVPSPALLAQTAGGESQQFFTTGTWREFTRTVEEHYLRPRKLSVVELSPRQLAKVLGHAIARQAPYVGDDPQRRARYESLRAAAESALVGEMIYLSWLTGDDAGEAEAAVLSEDFAGAVQGLCDDEILALTGVRGDETVPSVLSAETAAAASARVPAPLRLPAVDGPPAGERQRCRFYVDPSLYTDAKPDYEWALVLRPWRGGFYYETWPIDPSWHVEHAKQPQNRLRPGQEIDLTGKKSDILARIEQLRMGCR